MMKFVTVLCLICLLPVTIWAQDQDVDKRSLPVKISDKKGRPVKNITLESFNTGRKGMTDLTGQFIFEDMSDSDSISVKLPKYGIAMIPVAGMDSIVVVLRTTNIYDYLNKEKQLVSVQKEKATKNIVLDVPEILKKQSFSSLSDLLRGRVAGLQFTPTENGELAATIRGPSSFVSDNEPLVALDGMIVGTLREANTFINVYDIKTIEIIKIASEWGVRGSNGIIDIKTKRY